MTGLPALLSGLVRLLRMCLSWTAIAAAAVVAAVAAAVAVAVATTTWWSNSTN